MTIFIDSDISDSQHRIPVYRSHRCNQKGHLLSFWVKQSMQAAEINKIAYM